MLIWIAFVAIVSSVTGQTNLTCNSTWTFPSTTSTSEISGVWTVPGFSCAYTINGRIGYNIEIYCDPLQFNSAVDPCPNNFFKLNAQQNCNPPKVFYRYTQTQTMAVSVVAPSATGEYKCALGLKANMCSCGRKRVGDTQYTYSVLLKNATGQTFCGGSIVTPRDILTAASCVQNLTAIQITAAVGLNSDYAEYSINNIIIHTNYNPATGLYDLAILRTSVDIALNANVGVACMPITMIGSIPDNLAVSQVADTTYLNTATTLYRTTAPCNGESFFCTKSTVTPACGFLKGSAISWSSSNSLSTQFVIGVTTKFLCDQTTTMTGENAPVTFFTNIGWVQSNIYSSTTLCVIPHLP